MSDIGVSAPPPVEIAIAKSYPLDFACFGEEGVANAAPSISAIRLLLLAQRRLALQVHEQQVLL